MDDKKEKPGLALMIGLGKPKHAPPDSSSDVGMSDDDDESGEMDVILDELADAILSKDKEGIKQGLKALKEC